jgi:hypothetical protein
MSINGMLGYSLYISIGFVEFVRVAKCMILSKTYCSLHIIFDTCIRAIKINNLFFMIKVQIHEGLLGA